MQVLIILFRAIYCYFLQLLLFAEFYKGDVIGIYDLYRHSAPTHVRWYCSNAQIHTNPTKTIINYSVIQDVGHIDS